MQEKKIMRKSALPTLLIGAMIWAVSFSGVANAQFGRNIGTIDAGTTVKVRTVETITADDSDGSLFEGVIDQDVVNRNGAVAIPRGSSVELVVKEVSNSELALDLAAVTVNNQRYAIQADGNTVTSEQREGIGINDRTGKYVGGGALLGALVGAIAGGKKGAAIGAGVGAAGGAGTQILTRGRSVQVPAESLLTFRLQQPLRTGLTSSSVSQVDGNVSAAYRAGLQAGRSDWDRNLPRNTRSERYRTGQQRADYEAGYSRGYDQQTSQSSHITGRQKPMDQTNPNATASISIGRDNNIRWQAPAFARVYVLMDNEPLKLFAEGQSGVQAAPWIETGHLYIFVVQDARGNEIARDRLDLRRRR
jgi:hypothetical protein